MAPISYQRVDLAIVVQRAVDDGVIVGVGVLSTLHEQHLSPEVVDRWFNEGPAALAATLGQLLISDAIAEWRAITQAFAQALSPMPVIARLTLDLADPELATLAWEDALLAAFPRLHAPIIRVTPIAMRVRSRPFTLPLRILQIQPIHAIAAIIQRIFERYSPEAMARVVYVGLCPSLEDLSEWRALAGWPAAHVLHFDHFRMPESVERLCATSMPDVPGTLGWLIRLADTWQTRLIVISCTDAEQAALARSLAAALIGRGGPAVLINPDSDQTDDSFYDRFYFGIMHDLPFDQALSDAFSNRAGAAPSLFVGSGRSEALRVSTIGSELLRLKDDVATALDDPHSESARAWDELLARANEDRPLVLGPTPSPLERIADSLHNFDERLDSMHFGQEGGGLIPISNDLQNVRDLSYIRGPSTPAPVRPATVDPRYLNASLWFDAGRGALEQLPQRTGRLTSGQIYQLGVQIGPRDVRIRVVGATALVEDVFKWTPEMEGIWVEIGVTGIDFELRGAPVQEVWLPREGVSELIYFAIIPRTPGVARLRFCLYYQQNVIQSYCLAALTLAPGGGDPALTQRTAQLGQALNLPAEIVGDVGYLARLEYSLTTSSDDMTRRPARALSIVANQHDGEKVITVKGADYFGVRIDRSVPNLVERIRTALHAISAPPIAGVAPELLGYDFDASNGVPNAGTEVKLANALTVLAELGWELYTKTILPAKESQEQRLNSLLAAEREIINIAHTLVEDVIPWSVIYDRAYDAGRQEDDDGQPVEHAVCMAALPNVDGSLPVLMCATHPGCRLHPDQVAQRRAANQPGLCEDTVVCPLHFWGFKHIIEIPPQQVDDSQNAGHDLYECILAKRPARLAIGMHGGLTMTQQHWTKLEALAKTFNATPTVAYRRDRVSAILGDSDLDLIYLYCHTRNQSQPYYFEFKDQAQPQIGKITAAQLSRPPKWEHHPLVFLNGCNSVGFSPDALSEFIKVLVNYRDAAGVIGTEIPIFEQLATEVGQQFLEAFLKGHAAGAILLDIRRALLAKRNPLGLAYTLYAAAQLSLDTDGDGQCR
jgi:hypothetical protein